MQFLNSNYQSEAEKLHNDINEKYRSAKHYVGVISSVATEKKLIEASKEAQKHISHLQDAQQCLLNFECSQVSESQRSWIRRLRIRTADLAPALAQKKRRALIRAERRLLQQKKKDLTGGAALRSKRSKVSVGLEAQNRRQVGMSFKRTRRILQQSLDQMDVANEELQNSTQVVRRAAGLTEDYAAAGNKGRSRMQRMNLQRYKDQITFGIAFSIYFLVCTWVIVKRIRRLFPNIGFFRALGYGFKLILSLGWSFLISSGTAGISMKETIEVVDTLAPDEAESLLTSGGVLQESAKVPLTSADTSTSINLDTFADDDFGDVNEEARGNLDKLSDDLKTSSIKAAPQDKAKSRHEEL